MTGRLNRICLLALLAAVLAATAAAQQAKPIANWVNLNQLVAGPEIRVTLAAGKTMRGFVQRVTAESLAIDATTSQEMLSRQDIRRVLEPAPALPLALALMRSRAPERCFRTLARWCFRRRECS